MNGLMIERLGPALPPSVLYSAQPQNLGAPTEMIYVPSPTGVGSVADVSQNLSWNDVKGAAGWVWDNVGRPVVNAVLSGGNATMVPMSGMPMQNGGGFNPAGLQAMPSCPEGYTRVGNRCVNPGAALPGGMPFTMQATNGNGAFGGTRVPMMVTQVVSRCGPNYVLGQDGLCYHKKVLPKRFRRWVPPTKPLLTGGDRNVLRKAATLKNRVKKAASSAGLVCRKTGTRAAPAKRKR